MIKNYFLAIFIFCFFPFIFTFIEAIYTPDFLKLSGSTNEVIFPILSKETFSSGKFQSEVEKFLSDRSGLRAVFIRLRNQLHFSFFGKIYAQKTVFGKENFLFEKDHIEAHIGIDYLGEKKINQAIEHLSRLKKILEQKKIPLIVILAPGKASFYPEYIADSFLSQKKEKSNYDQFKKILQLHNFNFIDYIQWMKTLDETRKTIYYPKGGTHWSYYTASIAMPILIDKISSTLEIKIPKVRIENGEITNLPTYNLDSDIFNSLNLLWSKPFGTYMNPIISFEGEALQKPNALIVGDSFYFTLAATKILEKIFSKNSNFRYYDKIEYSIDGSQKTENDRFTLEEEIFSRDLIILLVSEVNLKYFGYGFPERIIQLIESRK